MEEVEGHLHQAEGEDLLQEEGKKNQDILLRPCLE